MISIVNVDELRNVLRPTVYRPRESRDGSEAPVQDRSTRKAESGIKMIAESAGAR